MTDKLIVSREQATEIFKAISGIGELLKLLSSNPANAGVLYSIMSNLAVIQTNLTEMPRVTSN